MADYWTLWSRKHAESLQEQHRQEVENARRWHGDLYAECTRLNRRVGLYEKHGRDVFVVEFPDTDTRWLITDKQPRWIDWTMSRESGVQGIAILRPGVAYVGEKTTARRVGNRVLMTWWRCAPEEALDEGIWHRFIGRGDALSDLAEDEEIQSIPAKSDKIACDCPSKRRLVTQTDEFALGFRGYSCQSRECPPCNEARVRSYIDRVLHGAGSSPLFVVRLDDAALWERRRKWWVRHFPPFNYFKIPLIGGLVDVYATAPIGERIEGDPAQRLRQSFAQEDSAEGKVSFSKDWTAPASDRASEIESFRPRVLRQHRAHDRVAEAMATRRGTANPFDPIETVSYHDREAWRAEQEAIGLSDRPLREKVRERTSSVRSAVSAHGAVDPVRDGSRPT